ncbi:MAG: dihydroorotate dehydrogenase electron transfer subunit [Candidatus Kapaibacterium sp.]
MSSSLFADSAFVARNTRLSQVTKKTVLAPGLVTIRFRNPIVARETQAGQFVNVLPKIGATDPMLRRPFSVYQTDGDEAEIIIQTVGKGTTTLAATAVGEWIDVLGPLGNPWNVASADYETAVLVIGGVGVASMPLLTREITRRNIPIMTYYGARSKDLFALRGLTALALATDDGSEGFHGTNISLLRTALEQKQIIKPKLFVCGPTGMMRAAKNLASEFGIPCEVSLETEMACGIGICQGCPVMTDEATFAETGKRFRLVCTEGPSFESSKIVL